MTWIVRLTSCFLVALLTLLPTLSALAQETRARESVADNSAEVAGTPAEPVAADDNAEAAESPAQPVPAATPDQPKTMSGMSILGNEEAPKALVIVPWKSSELGDELGMSENLDDRALPIDKQVFMRKLQFYEIRKEE